MKSAIAASSLALQVAVIIVAPANAGLSQATISSPGGFIQTGAYDVDGCSIIAGGDLAANCGTGQDYHKQAFAGRS